MEVTDCPGEPDMVLVTIEGRTYRQRRAEVKGESSALTPEAPSFRIPARTIPFLLYFAILPN